MAITLKDIAAGNKRMADQPFTSYRTATPEGVKPVSTTLDDIKNMSEALKVEQAPDLSEREIESNRILSKIQEDITYLPKIYKEVVDMNKSLKKVMINIADSLQNMDGGGGFGSSLLGGLLGGGSALALGKKFGRGAKGAKGAAKTAKYSSKGRIIPKIGTYAGELVKDVKTAGQQLKGIGGKAIDEGVKLTKKAAGAGASKWKPFMSWLEKRSPKVFAKVGARLLAAGAGLALPGPGWIWTAVSVLGSLSLAYEVYQLWQEYKKESPTEDDKPTKVEEDASKPKVLKPEDAPKDDKVIKSNVEGKIVGDKAEGPVTKDGQTLNPGDPGYDEAAKELEDYNQKMRNTKEEIEANAADRVMGRGKYAKKPSKFTEAMNAVKGFFGIKPKEDTMNFESEETKDWGDVPVSDQEAKKYAGAFAKGGKIPAGKKGVVGEAGPELVEGPAEVTNGEDFIKKMQEGDAKLRQELEDIRMRRYLAEKLMSEEGFEGNRLSDFSAEEQKEIQEAANPYGASTRRAYEIDKLLNSPEYNEFMDPKLIKNMGDSLNVTKRLKDRMDSGQSIDPKSVENEFTLEEKASVERLAGYSRAKRYESRLSDEIAAISSNNDMAKTDRRFGDDKPTNIVSAPTVVNNSNQTNVVKTPVRNPDASYAGYQRSKYAS